MTRTIKLVVLVLMLASASLSAQLRGRDVTDLDAANAGRGRGGPPAKTPKDAAPIDLTGYWVSIVSEDWRFRMLTPPKGDFPNFLLNPAGAKLANEWDPARDEAGKDHCKAYGAPNIMRVPGRFHITWADDRTLKGAKTFEDMLRRTADTQIAGVWKMGRARGNWWLRARR